MKNCELSNEEFDKRVFKLLEDMTALQLVTEIPNIYSDIAEYFNNQILDEYEEENEYYMDIDEVIEDFLNGLTIEEKRKEYNYDDIALREDFGIFLDMLCKDGRISQWAYDNYDIQL